MRTCADVRTQVQTFIFPEMAFNVALVLLLALKLQAEIKTSKYISKLKEGESLPMNAILSEHDVNSHSECSLHCLRATACLGFNYKNSVDINCQLSNITDISKTPAIEGKWTFYQEVAIVKCERNIDPCKISHSAIPVFQIYNPLSDVCASIMNDDVIARTCQNDDVNQWWMWTTNNQIKHHSSGKCLDVNGEITSWAKLYISTCDSQDSGQQWSCDYNFIQVSGTDLNMNYGYSPPDVILSDSTGNYSKWRMFNSTNNVCSAKP